ncbi:YgaP family membrane protein [Hyphococcus sp.]|jgi:hypothetical protein|uniref:YgaP family membrane protein n=1 Tax=Hyphococcus sp. TaxID=2038636 RepID=UPI003D0FC49B
MKANMGTADRLIRLIVAGVIAYLYFTGAVTGLAATVLAVIAAAFVLTSLVGFCPLYAPFGLSTRKKRA